MGGVTGSVKGKEEISYHLEGSVLFHADAYKVHDNAHDIIGSNLGPTLRPISACPTEWWVSYAFKPTHGMTLHY